ncbi:MAG: transglycosylase domain-containing protein [Intestinibaculum porci]|uniref:transglycosylase domain-containing protein n=1 Tax=Intestinibaculum porci TaxID=2487118 RepID=UPI00240A125D|nr:transglycosylase domain-containing protein [Intestinibaculum porci]MDD6423165.1 transglycosylase domain-containing protein [Intestinibaculum porci]
MRRKTHRKQYVHRKRPPKRKGKLPMSRIQNGHLRRLSYVAFVVVIVIVLFFAAANAVTLKVDGKFLPSYASEAAEIAAKSKESDFVLSNPSKIYDSTGKLLYSFKGDTGGSYADYDEIPKDVVNAFIAIEDKTFWKNNGFSLRGTLRALVSVIKNGSMTQGGSTITQQLVRTIYLTREKSIGRKIKEIFLARDITKKYSKKKIMEYYVNSCCFSNNIYGITDAASVYFNKKPNQLTLGQATYLTAIPNRPALYNPYKNSQGIINRRNRILSAMLDDKLITKAQYTQATNEKITIAKRKTAEISDYATTYAIHSTILYLMKKDGFKFQYKWASTNAYNAYKKKYNSEYAAMKETLYTKGYTIKTTLNSARQKQLQILMNGQLARYSTRISNGSFKLQGALTVIDNKTHKVVGIIGGRQDSNTSSYSLNRAYQSPRQPGSTIKPLVVYTPALEQGKTAYSTLRNIDVQTAYDRKKSGYSIQNMGGSSMSLAQAVFKSVNGCAIYLYDQVTPTVGLNKLVKMRFNTVMPSDYGLASGLGGFTTGATTYEMANAYSTLANYGSYTQADCLTSIKDKDEKEIYKAPASERVYSESASQKMTGILRGVITKGTASSMNWSAYSSTDAAGKTGTTNSNKDAWFCGYTPYYSISVWCGNDDPEDTSLYGGTAPVQIWRSIQSYMLRGKETAHFENASIPSGYSSSYSSSSYYRRRKTQNSNNSTTTGNTNNAENNANTNGNTNTDQNTSQNSSNTNSQSSAGNSSTANSSNNTQSTNNSATTNKQTQSSAASGTTNKSTTSKSSTSSSASQAASSNANAAGNAQ